MKKLIFTAVILLSCLTFKNANAQLRLSLGVNIGAQPDWGPVGYDHADYYYIPDVGAYYDVNAHQYIYLENNVWVHRGFLPDRYRNYDLYGGYKVVVNGRNPWMHDNVYRTKYAGYRGRRGQSIIRDSHDNHYANHWHGDDGHGGGHGNNGHNGGNHGHNGGDHGHNGGDHGHDH
ncbi:hypothetical protein [Mucilaginibacter sp.]